MAVVLKRAGEPAFFGIGGKLGESGGPLTWRPVVWNDKEAAREKLKSVPIGGYECLI